MSLVLLGLGTARPPHTISQDAMARAATPCCTATQRQRRLLPALYRKASVQSRHLAVLNQAGGPPPVTKAPSPTSPSMTPPAAEPDGGDAPDDARVERMLAVYPPAAAPSADTGAGVTPDRGPSVGDRMRRYPEEALTLAEAACRAALEEANIPAQAVGQLVVVTCTGFSAPGVDIGLIDRLGLPAGVGRTAVGFMGCHGAMNGLRVARSLADGLLQPGQVVLMCCVELCSLHFQYGWDPQKVVANALFGDGAAAIVGRPCATDGADELFKNSADATVNQLPRVAAHGSLLLPDSRDAMTWLIRDHGFEMTLSAKVPDLIRRHLRGWFEPWIQSQNLELSAIGGWAIHPGGPRVISAVEEALQLPVDADTGRAAGDASRDILQTHGNMSSPTVLFILDRLRALRTPRPWVTLAFGPGLTIEAALLR